eukprot:jgi/Botrbrau1/9933/Bobra.0012s0030.1
MAALFRRSLCRGIRRLIGGTQGTQQISCSEVEFGAGSTALHTLTYPRASSGCLVKFPTNLWNGVQTPALRSLQQFTGLPAYSTEVDDRREIFYPVADVFIGEPAPDFTAPAVIDGEISNLSLSNYKGKYVCLFFYPKDFTFVCPTEIIAFSDRAKEFEELGCQLIAASTDTEEVHLAWIRTPRKKGGLGRMQIPIVADTTKEISSLYGVLLPKLGIALRGLFIIDPEGVVQHITINSLGVGRNVDEAKRLLQAIQFVKEHGEVCPAGWTPGGKTMVADPDKSLEYFTAVKDTDEEFGSRIQSISSKKEFEAVIKGSEPVVIDFFAPWCGKCRQIAPYVEELQDKYAGIKFYKFDTTEDALEQHAADLGVGLLPTFRFYKGGKQVVDSVTGYKKRPLGDAVEKLAKI